MIEADKGGFDIAILDVNLKGESVWPVAERLREQQIPFVLATGGHVDPPPAQFANVPVIEKPYTVDRVTPALEAAFAELSAFRPWWCVARRLRFCLIARGDCSS